VIVLGVSGGSDSVALLHGLLKLSSIDGSVFPSNPYPYRTFTPLTINPAHQQSQMANDNTTVTCIPIELHVVHFDHQQREKDSDQDRQFVQDLCLQNRVPFHCYYWKDHINTEVGTNNCGSKPFTQDMAREWRRSTMVQLLHQLINSEHNSSPEGKDTTQEPHKGPNHFTKLGVIMTAHHLNDSEETILLKLLRGVHISRLQGIEAVSSSVFSQNPVLFARPLIQLRKEEIKEYLIVNQLCWREDSSNEEPKYLRNRIRNELIPLLEDLVGGRGNLQVKFHFRTTFDFSVKQIFFTKSLRFLSSSTYTTYRNGLEI
jgi:tRNA(Ile)-lysidine synthetase-like protein